MTALLPFTCIAAPANTSFSGCTLHTWNFDPQASASYAVGSSGNLFVTFADRGRFPMLKDIYSAGLGSGLPNPDLRPEHSRNWNLGYSHTIALKTVGQVVLFRSDLRNAIESVYVTGPGGANRAPSSALTAKLTFSASYSCLNRDIAYNFGGLSRGWPELVLQPPIPVLAAGVPSPRRLELS